MGDPIERMFPILGDQSIRAIPWAVIAPHEKQAQSNHSQSLERLASRGGLDVSEAMNVMTGHHWSRRLDLSWARARLMQMVWQFERERMEEVDASTDPEASARAIAEAEVVRFREALEEEKEDERDRLYDLAWTENVGGGPEAFFLKAQDAMLPEQRSRIRRESAVPASDDEGT